MSEERPNVNTITSYGEHSDLDLQSSKNSSMLSGAQMSIKQKLYERRLSNQATEILDDLRSKGQLCDSILKLDDGSEFPIHKVVLSASSQFFKALFTSSYDESNKIIVNLKDINSDTMRLIIEWAYTRNVAIDSENVECLLCAADRFQILGLVNLCAEFLEQCLSVDNCIGFRKFANIFCLLDLSKKAHSFLMYNFLEICSKSQEFIELDCEEFANIIKSDELNLKNECELFEIILKWIDHNPSERKKFIEELLENIRLGLISKKHFFDLIRKNSYIRDALSEQVCKQLVRKYHQLNDLKPFDLNDLRTRPRTPHEILVVIGGWSSGLPTNSLEYYDPRADLWQVYPFSDKLPRAYHGSIVFNNNIYVIGGYDSSHYFNNCRRFDLLSKKWHEIAPMHTKRCYVSVAKLDEFVYAMGGYDGVTRQNSAEKYCPETNQWTQIADMNAQRSDASATEHKRKIFICGGFNGVECLNTAEFYDPETNVWTMITQTMHLRRSGVGCASLNGFVYAVGGYDGSNRLSSCEKYDLANNKWIKCSDMHSPRSNFSLKVFDGCLYAMGGFNGLTTIPDVEVFDDRENEWKPREKMLHNRSALSSCVIDGLDFVRPLSAIVTQKALLVKMNQQFLKKTLYLT